MIALIRTLSVAGAFVMLATLLALTLFQQQFERSALGFAKSQITAEMQARFPALGDTAVPQGLQKLADRLGVQQAAQEKLAQGDLPNLIGAVIARRCSCTEPTQAEIAERANIVRANMAAYATRLGQSQERVIGLIQGKYDAIIAALRQDVIIMLSSNLIAFLAVLGASFAPTTKRPLLIYPSVLLIAAIGISTSLYLFTTDWFYAIIFQDYYGWAYAALLAVIFAFLLDIVLNYARVTLKLLSHLPSAMVPPC